MRRLITEAKWEHGLGGFGRLFSVKQLSFGAFCWLLLWVGINTGPGNIDVDLIEGSWTGLFNGVRAAFPLAVLAAWSFHVILRQRHAIRGFTLPEGLWLYYGIICLVASVYTDPWFDYAYWGFAYLSAFAATEIYLQESSSSKRPGDLNRLNWLFASLVLVILVWVARGSLLAETSYGVSGYGVLDRMPTVAGMPMVRASGISRLAAVPGIVAFAAMCDSRGYGRILSVVIFAAASYLVWVMQSRGSLVSFAVALTLMLILLGGRARLIGIFVAAVLVTMFGLGFIPGNTVNSLYLYATRGAHGGQLESMSGRTRIFEEAWQAIRAAPFIGYGPQADRQINTIGNGQNGVLYALLCGGLVGGMGYVLGILVTWFYLIRILRRRHALREGERLTLIQVAGIMAFFTMRSFPENCAALFSVDLLIQLPAMVYLSELDRALRRKAGAQRVYRSRLYEPADASIIRAADSRC